MTEALLTDCANERDRYRAKTYPAGFPRIPPIPTARYTSEEMWALEQQQLWTKTWLCAGHVDELPEPGSYKLWRDSGPAVLLVRGKDGAIRGFFNTCMHRGGPLVHDECGKVAALSCRFHRWTYDLAGQLASVPDQHEFKDLDKATIHLRQVRCELWGNFIFINRDLDAEPLLKFLGPIVEEFRDLKMETRKIYKTVTYDLQSNWKIAVASNVESYHLPPVHPQTVHQMIDYTSLTNYLYINGHSQQIIPRKGLVGQNDASVFDRGDASTDPEHELTRNTVRNYFIFPNMLISAAEFQFPIVVYWPVDVRTTRWLVMYTAPEGRDDPESPECSELVKMLDVILQEDIANLVWMQDSYDRGLIDKVQISYAERRISHFEEEIDRRIGTQRIPARLRMDRVLEKYVMEPSDVLKGCAERIDEAPVQS